MLVVELRNAQMLEEDYEYGYQYSLPMTDEELDMIVEEFEVESVADIYITNQYTDLPIHVVGEELLYLNNGLQDLLRGLEPYEEPYRWLEIKALLELDLIDLNDIMYGFPHIEDYKFYHLDTNVEVEEDPDYEVKGVSSDHILVKENMMPF
jgi:hypothetical protein